VCVKIFLMLLWVHFYVKYSFTARVSQMFVLPEKIFGRKFEDIMGNWRKLHKEEHHNMCTRLLLGSNPR